VRIWRNIGVISIALIYLVSTTGVLVYKSYCFCTGEGDVSIYVAPETCSAKIHQHHTHNGHENEISCCAAQCHECSDNKSNCGCSTPEAFFFKLKNLFIEEETLLVKAQLPEIALINIDINYRIDLLVFNNQPKIIVSDSPPLIISPIDFLIQIQQLKIPSIA
jgi:hypothetical protein